jgi:dinuclear metal center YbgI/SA1388 family protein
MNVSQFIRVVDRLAPFRLAESWDNVGLQIGDPTANISRVMVCLEVNAEVLAEAVRQRVDLLLAHHPLLLEPVSGLRADRYPQELALELIRNNLSLVVAHTNLDCSPMGTNAALAELIGLESRRPLIPGSAEKRFKIVVFTPAGYEGEIIEAIYEGGGGVIGDYDHCTARTACTGTFRGSEAANPFIGQVGRLEEVSELRIEAVAPERRLRRIVKEVLKAHPYDEVAYDIYPLASISEEWGFGLIGMLPRRAKLKAFINRLKSVLGVKTAQFIGRESDFSVKTIAVLAGSVNSTIGQILDRNFDVIVVGEMKHHRAQEVMASGMNAICVGHFASERPVASYFSRILERQEIIAQSNVEILVSQTETDPFRAV